MRFRLLLFLATTFFVTMNVLLWRAEYGGRGRAGAGVPPELIWEKILTAPDISSMEIRYRGEKLGRATWAATIGEGKATGRVMDELPPEGMVQVLGGYTLDFDGHLNLPGTGRLKFNSHLDLDTNQAWQNLRLQFALKPFALDIAIDARTQQTTVKINDGENITERVLPTAALRDPGKLAREFGAFGMPAAMAAMGLRFDPAAGGDDAARAFHWEASNDRLKIGNSLVRVYRLEARLLGTFRANLFVSPVGELLRVELPDEAVLVNEALLNL